MLAYKAPSLRIELSRLPQLHSARLVCVQPRAPQNTLRPDVLCMAIPQPPKAGAPAERPARPAMPFNEGMESVRRLVNRDKKEFINAAGSSSGDILEKFVTEFGDGARDGEDGARRPAVQPLPGASNPFDGPATLSTSAPASSGIAATPAASSSSSPTSSSPASSSKPAAPTPSPFAAGREIGSATPNPFKATGTSPFAAPTVTPKPFRSSIEPAGLSPDMGPDDREEDKPFDLANLLAGVTMTQVVIFSSFFLIISSMLVTFGIVLNAGGISIAGLD